MTSTYVFCKHLLKKPSVWLVLITIAVSVVGSLYGFKMIGIAVMPDELGYMKQAVHIKDTLSFSMPGELWYNSPAQIVPLLYAPFYLFFPTTDAVMGTHILNSTAFGLSGIPIYLVTKKVTQSSQAAVVAATLTTVTPWLAMSGSLMIEPIAYLAFAWTFWGMSNAAIKRDPQSLMIALSLIMLATFTRTQLIVLFPAFLLSLSSFTLRTFRKESQRKKVKTSVIFLTTAIAVFIILTLTHKINLLVGNNYGGVLKNINQIQDTFTTAHETFAYVITGTGIISFPLMMAWSFNTFFHSKSPEKVATAATIFITCLVIVLSSQNFILRFTTLTGILDRYMMYTVPLIATGSICFLWEKKVKTLWLTLSFLGSSLLLFNAELSNAQATFTGPGEAIQKVFEGRLSTLPFQLKPPLFFALFTVVSAAILLSMLSYEKRQKKFFSRKLVVSFLLSYTAFATGYTLNQFAKAYTPSHRSSTFLAYLRDRDWVDQQIKEEKAGLVLSMVFDEQSTVPTLWEAAFWSKQTDQAWRLKEDTRTYHFPFVHPIEISSEDGHLTGEAINSRKFLVRSQIDRRFQLQGTQILKQQNGFNLIHANQPYRAVWSLRAKRDDGLIDANNSGYLRIYATGIEKRRTLTIGATKPIELPVKEYHLPTLLLTGCGKTINIAPRKKTSALISYTIKSPEKRFCEVSIRVVANTQSSSTQVLLERIDLQ